MHSPTTDDVRRLEDEIAKLKARLSQLRRIAPRKPVADYEFRRADGTTVRLSELFGGKSDLLIIHNMGSSCPYCTLWADGFSGIRHHVESRAALVVCSPDDPAIQREFAASRGWGFRMISSAGTAFTRDMGFETGAGRVGPGASAFKRREDGTIDRVGRFGMFGPGDDFCAAWHLFDLLDGGVGDWEPAHAYDA